MWAQIKKRVLEMKIYIINPTGLTDNPEHRKNEC